MRGVLCLPVLLVLASVSSSPIASAQELRGPAPPLERPLRVFIDCRARGCDSDFFRRELTWVDHVPDQGDADVHVLVTAQPTGGGGSAYTVRFISRGPAAHEEALGHSTEAAATDDDVRRALRQTFALGLAHLAAQTPAGRRLRILPPEGGAPAAQSAPDPWDFWVFRTSFNSFLNGERSSRFASGNLNISANRTTPGWKLNVASGLNYSENRFELANGTIFRSVRRGHFGNALAVKSVTDHWSVGGRVGVSRSSFLNQRLAARVAPGIEFNVFPYRESSDRQLTIQWSAGLNHFDYDQETLFGRTEETRWDQALVSQLSLRRPFGTVSLTAELANYLDDRSKYRFVVFADNELRLTRGLSFRLDGSYALVHDQLYLPRGAATDAEILVRQRQLETSFRYFLSVGLTYRFGSINNNVVNPRFGSGPGGGGVF